MKYSHHTLHTNLTDITWFHSFSKTLYYISVGNAGGKSVIPSLPLPES